MNKTMNNQDFELLSRYVDGEASPAERAALETRLPVEPDLTAALAQIRAGDARLRRAFRQREEQTVPERIRAMLTTATNVVPLRRQRATWTGLALAASVVAAVSAVLLTQNPPGTDPTGRAPTDRYLANHLERATSRGAGWDTLPDGRQARAVLSFRNVDGNWCREFLLAGDQGSWHGVACRDTDGWVTEVLASADVADDTPDYRPAGADTAGAVEVFVANRAAGIPLSAEEEAALIARQWQ